MFTENKKKFLIIVRVAEIFMRKSKYIIILEELIEKIEGEGSLVVKEQCLVGKEVTRNIFDVYTIVVNTEV